MILWHLHKSIKFLHLLHKRAIDNRPISWLLPASKQSQPYIESKSNQFHCEEHGLLFITITDKSNRNEADGYKRHIDEADGSEVVEVVFDFVLIFAFVKVEPRFDNADQEDDETDQSKSNHDIGGDRVVHVVLVMLAVTYFVEHCHYDID